MLALDSKGMIVYRAILLLSIFLMGGMFPVSASSHLDIVPARINARFEHLTIEDGLSQNTVLTSFQDSQGYMWFGTQDGLNRYDGYEFTVFRHEGDDKTSISSSSVLSIVEDASGYLWVGTSGGGLNRFNPISETFTVYRHQGGDPTSLCGDVVTDLLISRGGTFWVATNGGLCRFNPQSGAFIQYRYDPDDKTSLSADNLSVLFEDRDGDLWIGTGFYAQGQGLNRYEPESNSFTRFMHDSKDPQSLGGNNVSAIFQDISGNIWVGTGGYELTGSGLDKLDPIRETFMHFRNEPGDPYSLSNDNVSGIWQDESGYLWVSTLDGLNLYAPTLSESRFTRVYHEPFDENSLSTNMLGSIFEDKSGVAWIATYDAGVEKYVSRRAQFRLYQHLPNDPKSLASNAVSSFYEDSLGNFWVGTSGNGFDLFDRLNDTFTHYKYDPSSRNGVPSAYINSFYEDSSGRFWLSTREGLALFNRDTGWYTTFRHDSLLPFSLGNDIVNQVLETPEKDALWVATLGGLDLFTPARSTFKHYTYNQNDNTSLGSNNVTSLAYDRTGRLWVGTWGGGLSRYNPETDSFTRLESNPDNGTTLSDNFVWVIFSDSKGRLWVGTQSGLNRLLSDGSFKHYGLNQGLPSEVILGIVEDPWDNLWVSTGNGLARMNPSLETFKAFDVNDGLQGNEFNPGAYYKDRSGILYFGGANGFSAFNPSLIRTNTTPPQVAVTRFRVFNEPVQVDLSGRKPLIIPYWQNFISFEFSSLDFSAPLKNKYQYKLEGFDESWINAGARRYASYTNLPGGNYVFRVKATNNDGIWSQEGITIPITITPPIWKTWWFQAVAFVLVVGTVITGFSLRVRGIQKQKQDLEWEVNQRTEELRLAKEELAARVEEELAQSEARFKAMFDNAAVGIVILGDNRRILNANPAMSEMLGRSIENLCHIRLSECIHSDDLEKDEQQFHDLMAGRLGEYQLEWRFIRKDASEFWARGTLSAVRNANGESRFAVAMIQDINEQKMASEKIAEQEREYREHLEQRVAERTHDLEQANNMLVAEIDQRKRAEEALSTKAAEEAVVAERTRLARELHDAVTQTLFSASLIADILPRLWRKNPEEGARSLEELRQLTRGALAEMRTLLLELRPAALTQGRFEDLLRQLTEAVAGRARLQINLTVDGERKLPPEVQVALYRISQESLNNIVKYAHATAVDVFLSLSTTGAHLEIRDNGIGFKQEQARPTNMGLRIMRERAEAINAEFEIVSRAEEGTIISVTWQEAERGES